MEQSCSMRRYQGMPDVEQDTMGSQRKKCIISNTVIYVSMLRDETNADKNQAETLE